MAKAKNASVAVIDSVADVDTSAEEKAVEAKQGKQNLIPKDIDPSQYVYVYNGFHGELHYKSRRTGEKFTWNSYGSEQEMELRELRNARNTDKAFFMNNWFMFEEEWIIDYLGLRQFYKNAIPIDSFDDIFSLSADKLKEKVRAMSRGQQKSVAYRAQELIREKKLDSLSVIEALEEAIGIELLEK